MRVTVFVLAGTALCLAACNQPAASHDKAYFTAHPQERARTLVTCRNDPGQTGAGPNCVNAIRSDADAEHDRVFHSAPPVVPGVNNTGHM